MPIENLQVKLTVLENRVIEKHFRISSLMSFKDKIKQYKEPLLAIPSVFGVMLITNGGLTGSMWQLGGGGFLLATAIAPVVHEIRRGWNKEFPMFHG